MEKLVKNKVVNWMRDYFKILECEGTIKRNAIRLHDVEFIVNMVEHIIEEDEIQELQHWNDLEGREND